MKTKREKHLVKIGDGRLIKYFHSHADRAIDRLLSGLSNLQIAIREENMENVASARDYLVKALEDVSALRFAGKEVQRRYIRTRIRDKHKANYIKEVLKRDLPEQEEVELPGDFFALSTKQRGGKE